MQILTLTDVGIGHAIPKLERHQLVLAMDNAVQDFKEIKSEIVIIETPEDNIE